MKDYIIRIVGAALLATLADILSPSDWRKYIAIVSGMIILCTISSPIASIKGIDINLDAVDTEDSAKAGEALYRDRLSAEFSKSIALDIKERIRQEFSKDVSAEVSVRLDDDGKIDKISSIVIKGRDIDQKIADRIAFIYDVDEVVTDAGG